MTYCGLAIHSESIEAWSRARSIGCSKHFAGNGGMEVSLSCMHHCNTRVSLRTAAFIFGTIPAPWVCVGQGRSLLQLHAAASWAAASDVMARFHRKPYDVSRCMVYSGGACAGACSAVRFSHTHSLTQPYRPAFSVLLIGMFVRLLSASCRVKFTL